jgi:hypothetical protein
MGRPDHSLPGAYSLTAPDAETSCVPASTGIRRVGREGTAAPAVPADERRKGGRVVMAGDDEGRRPIARLLAAAAMTVAVLALAGPAGAQAPESGNGVVNGYGPARPVLECVTVNGDGSYTAVFGTDNPAAVTDEVPIGRANRLSPGPADRGQPTSIPPGRAVAAFTTTFDGGTLVWSLNGRTSTASVGSRPCGTAPNVSEAPQVLALAVVIGGLILAWLRRSRRDVVAHAAT